MSAQWSSSRGYGSAHACHCIGCCRKCGTCRTWPGHMEAYCLMRQRHARELRDLCAALDLERPEGTPPGVEETPQP